MHKRHFLLFLFVLFFYHASAQEKDSLYVQPDSSRAAGWAVLLTPTERVSSAFSLTAEFPLLKRKPHTRLFFTPTMYRGRMSEDRFEAPEAVATGTPRSLFGESLLRGGGLEVGLRQPLVGQPLFARYARFQVYGQFSTGFNVLLREFEGLAWRLEDNGYSQVLTPYYKRQHERLYRTAVTAGLGFRMHTPLGLFLDAFVGLRYRRVWQGENFNHGWREVDPNELFRSVPITNFNFQGAAPYLSASVGWAMATGPKYHLGTSERKLVRAQKQRLRKVREAQDSSRYQLLQFQFTPTDAFLGSFPVAFEFSANDSTANKAAHFHMALVFHAGNLRRGLGGVLGMRYAFGGRPFYTGASRSQPYFGFLVGAHSAGREEQALVNGQWDFVKRQMTCIEFGVELGTRKYTPSGFVWDFFVGTNLRYGGITDGPALEDGFQPTVVDFNYRGFLPRFGVRLGLYQESGRKLWAKK
jgi:hypothetical protein